MKLVIFILSNCDLLTYLISDLADAGIKGATVINSTGMGMMLSRMGNNSIGSSLGFLFDTSREDNKTIMLVTTDEKIPVIKKVITDVVGDLSKPDTGIFFTIPVSDACGGGF